MNRGLVRWSGEWPLLLVLAAMFVLALASWPTAPERIPMHWNFAGDVDGYGGKFEGLLAIPLLTLGIYLLMLVVPLIDPGRANYARFYGPYTVIRFGLVIVMALLYGVIHLWIRGHPVNVATVVPILIGGLLIVIGSVLAKIRPNWFLGIRTPWTLSSKTAWVKTQRLGGWLFIIAGLVMVAVGILHPRWGIAAILVCAVGATLVTVLYSYLVWRRDPDKIPPAGTLPADGE